MWNNISISLLLLLGICQHHIVNAGKMRFPESAAEETGSETSEASKVIDEILSASRAGRSLTLSVGGKDLEPLSLASDPNFKQYSTQTGTDVEARNYVAEKLCSLGLAKCGGGSEVEGRHGGQYGSSLITNLRDVTLVQPVALKPVGEPIAAIPLNNRPAFGSTSSYGKSYDGPSFGNFGSENQNYPNYKPQQGGIVSPQDCTCVSVNQCNSYDIVGPVQSGSSNPGVISGIGQPNYGNVGAGIDPRNNRNSAIESNATVIEADEPLARSARSEGGDVELTNATSREKREAPLQTTNPRVINGGYRGCYDDRQVCCRFPIRNPNTYPSGSVNYPGTGGSNSNYPGPSNYPSYPSPNVDYNPNNPYPNKPVTNEYYPSSSNGGLCGKRNSKGINGRVLAGNYGGGNSAEFGEYPWQVALLKKDGTNSVFVCGASLIDNKHILTAAHCIKNHRPEELRVRLGEWDVNSENEFYPHVEQDVAAIAIHPEYYAGNLINDVALIKMTGYIDFSRYPHISPICLPSYNYDFTGTRCHVTGWGKDAFGQGGKFQTILQEVDVPVLNNYECEQRLKRTRLGPDFTLHKGFLCAGGEPEKDACKGDGGSPLSCEVGGTWQLAGIVSWGVGCGSYGTPGVYVKTSAYLDWIRQTINQ